MENNVLKIRLINTRGFKLEEATHDKYWGTGVPVYSREFRNPKYPGKNIMGHMLEEIREEFSPSVPPSLAPPVAQQSQEVQNHGQLAASPDKSLHLEVL